MFQELQDEANRVSEENQQLRRELSEAPRSEPSVPKAEVTKVEEKKKKKSVMHTKLLVGIVSLLILVVGIILGKMILKK